MPKRGEQAGHAFAAVDPHQVVLQRQVKARRAGVALSAGPAAKLIVDPATVVPFGADDVQAAQFGDLAALLLHLFGRFDFIDRLLPHFVRHFQPGRVIVPQPRPRQRFGIAAENDVGAATGHVRGDRHRIEPAGLSDDLGFAGHELRLGIQQFVLDAAFACSRAESFSDFSTDAVPIRIGRPVLWTSTTSSTTASHFSFS